MAINGCTYKPNQIVITSSDLLPCFGMIIDIYVTDVDNIYLVLKKLDTISFVSHFHAYCVSFTQPITYLVTKISHLYDSHPLSLYIESSSNEMYVPLKYHIVESY